MRTGMAAGHHGPHGTASSSRPLSVHRALDARSRDPAPGEAPTPTATSTEGGGPRGNPVPPRSQRSGLIAAATKSSAR